MSHAHHRLSRTLADQRRRPRTRCARRRTSGRPAGSDLERGVRREEGRRLALPFRQARGGADGRRAAAARDKPGTSDPAVAEALADEALADAELQFGYTIPTGTYLDMTANLPVVDPARVQAPVLLVRGEHDGIATEEDLTGT
jgi:pimeloyl-ACP methyl ester carboxylesterase